MASHRSERPPQVNITLDPADGELLAALAFLDGSSASEVIRPVVERFLREQRDDAEVKAVLKVRAKRQRSSRK